MILLTGMEFGLMQMGFYMKAILSWVKDQVMLEILEMNGSMKDNIIMINEKGLQD